MPGYERDQAAIDSTVENRQLGSIMLTAGWILLWFDAILFAFFFISLRDGSYFWPIWVSIEGVVGVSLVIAGTRYKGKVGPTPLGQRDRAGIERELRREKEEQKHVA